MSKTRGKNHHKGNNKNEAIPGSLGDKTNNRL